MGAVRNLYNYLELERTDFNLICSRLSDQLYNNEESTMEVLVPELDIVVYVDLQNDSRGIYLPTGDSVEVQKDGYTMERESNVLKWILQSDILPQFNNDERDSILGAESIRKDQLQAIGI